MLSDQAAVAKRSTFHRCGLFLAGMILICVSGCDSSDDQSPRAKPVPPSPSKTAADRADGKPSKSAGPPSLAAAKIALDSGRFEQAIEMVKDFLIVNPNDPQALILVSQCLFSTQQPDQAIEMLREIAPEDPNFGLNALGQIADWQMQNGKPQESIETFRRLIKYHGDIPLAHSRMALLFNSQGKRFEATPHLLTLAQMDDITRRELGALVTISDQCAVSKVPGTTGQGDRLVEGDLRRARQMNMGGRWQEGLQLTKQLRAKFPDSASIAAFLGKSFMDLQLVGDLEAWHQDLPQGITGQPLYWSTMARWMKLLGRHEEAIHCACRALALDPTNRFTYETLAYSLGATGNQQAMLSAQLRAETLRDARSIYQKTFQRAATADDFIRLSRYMLELNRPFESVAWLKEAIKTDKRNAGIQTVSQMLQTYQPPVDLAGWITCGVDVNKFPAPDASRIAVAISSTDNPDAESTEAKIRLTDVAESLEIDFQYDPGNQQTDGSYLLHHTMGGGIGMIDFDRDGWPDVYFSQGGGKAFSNSNLPNHLSRNLDGKSFVDVTTSAGVGDTHYGQGVTAADFNQDGFTDLIVANIGPNVLYRNNGDGSFTEVSLPQWSDKDFWTSQVACADLNGDSLVELVECNYIDDPRSQSIRCTVSEQLCAPAAFTPSINRGLTGNLDSTFSVWSDGPRLDQSANYSLGVIVCNLDDQNGNDLFVANDTRENTLWISQPNNGSDDSRHRFSLVEQARLRGCATGSLGELQGCMGIATGDFDRNERFDMYVTNYYNEPSNLFLQQDAGLFIDGASLYSARESSVPKVGFGTQATDLESDGWLDLVVLNGHAVDRRDKGEPLQMMPQIYRGSRGMMNETTPDEQYWKMPTLGRALARWDYNRDGRMDFLANHLDRSVAVLKNESVGGNWVQIELVGTLSERDATGCKVILHCADQSWVSWVTAGDGYFCTNEPVLHVGIDQSTEIDRMEIQWPSGLEQQIRGLKINGRYLVIEGIDESFQQ